MVDKIFKAIRSHKKLGKGSCSTIDECQTDEQLISDINGCLEEGYYTNVEEAIEFYSEIESAFWERQGIDW